MSKKTATGRTPSLPERQSLKPEQPGDMVKALYEHNPAARAEMDKRNQEQIEFVNRDATEQFFIDVLTGKKTPAAKGRWSAASGQVQNIPRSASMPPVFAAPYGQDNKDKTND